MENLIVLPRTFSHELMGKSGQEVRIEGWLHSLREMGSIAFIIVRDKHGMAQAVCEDSAELAKLDGLYAGTVLRIVGTVEKAPTKLGVELKNIHIEVLQPVTHVAPVDISKEKLDVNLNTLFSERVVTLRHPRQQAIFRIYSDVLQHIRRFFVSEGFVEISTPKIIAAPTEGGSEVFYVDYFGEQACLAQSPQFYKQMMVGVFERVFEIGRVFRAENSHTSRHTTEINMLDMEMGFIDGLDDILRMSERFLLAVVRGTEESSANDFQLVSGTKGEVSAIPLMEKFPRIRLDELHELMKKETGKDYIGERDASPDEEQFICEYARKEWGSDAVLITHFPWSDAKFYHKRSESEPDFAERADLIFRGVEIATIPVRESRYEVLIEQMREKGLDAEHEGFRYYLGAFKYGLPPHGGFGFGIARLVEKLIGLENVKEAELFPRDPGRMVP